MSGRLWATPEYSGPAWKVWRADDIVWPCGTPGPAAYTAESQPAGPVGILRCQDTGKSAACPAASDQRKPVWYMDEETILSIIKNEAAIPICILPDSSTTQGTQKKAGRQRSRKELEQLDALLERMIRNELQ